MAYIYDVCNAMSIPKVGNEEMASDQFGSGGGFSTMFNRSEHATWQVHYIAHMPMSMFNLTYGTHFI